MRNSNRLVTARKTILVIGGSDSSNGAGIQADLRTVHAMGCDGATVITAVTAQNARTITEIMPVKASIVAKQIETIFSDRVIDAIKIGMLYTKNIIQTVLDCLQQYRAIPVVIDPEIGRAHV